MAVATGVRGDIQAGELDRLISLYHRVITKNDTGEEVADWPTAYAQVWAKKRDLRGDKRLLAQQFSSDTITDFTIRYRTDVLQTDRVIDSDGKVYEIRQSSEVGRRVALDIQCRAITP